MKEGRAKENDLRLSSLEEESILLSNRKRSKSSSNFSLGTHRNAKDGNKR
jgi:hypothetical protein